jgi:ABC-2 type transport system ATP-binding protein
MSNGKIIALGTPGELKTTWMKESVVDLECDDLMRAAELLEHESVFTEVAVFGNLIHLVSPHPEAAIARAREILEREGVRVSRIETTTPSLEDVFVTLTAKDRNEM